MQMIELFLKDLTGRTITIETNVDLTVKELKVQVEHCTGVVPEQRLIYAGQQWEGDRLLLDHGLKHLCTLHSVLRLRGGKYGTVSFARCLALSDAQIVSTGSDSEWHLVPGQPADTVTCASQACSMIHPGDKTWKKSAVLHRWPDPLHSSFTSQMETRLTCAAAQTLVRPGFFVWSGP